MNGISVALCTCNGAPYIGQQLDSILNQTYSVDEIVICDDTSTDGTVEILKEYSSKFPIIRLFLNSQCLGVCANFDKALHLCSGDLILLSDQDDIWRSDKVETINGYFKRNPEKSVVFTDAILIDVNDKILPVKHKSLFQYLKFNAFARLMFNCGYSLDLLVLNYRVTGATVAIRKEYLERITIDHDATPQNLKPLHDARISLYAASDKVLGYITKPLVSYRIHADQQVGLGKKNIKVSNNIFISTKYGLSEYITDADILPERLNRKYKFIGIRKEYVNTMMGPLSHFKAYSTALGRKKAIIIWIFDILHSFYRSLKINILKSCHQADCEESSRE